MIHGKRCKNTVMPMYGRLYKFNIILHFLILVPLHFHAINSYAMLSSILTRSRLNYNIGIKKRAIPGKSSRTNVIFSLIAVHSLFALVAVTWLAVLLLCSGDIHPNPGPSSVSSSDNLSNNASSLSSSILQSLTTGHSLSFIH